jgi:hypothetical protein
MEPRERGDEEYYYQATDMSTEQVNRDKKERPLEMLGAGWVAGR